MQNTHFFLSIFLVFFLSLLLGSVAAAILFYFLLLVTASNLLYTVKFTSTNWTVSYTARSCEFHKCSGFVIFLIVCLSVLFSICNCCQFD